MKSIRLDGAEGSWDFRRHSLESFLRFPNKHCLVYTHSWPTLGFDGTNCSLLTK